MDGSISDTVLGLLAQGRVILIAGIIVLVVASVAQTYLRTRSWVPAIGVALVGAGALWLASNIGDVRDTVESEVNEAPGHAGDIENEAQPNAAGS
jgi:hypothetical protein